MIHFDVLESHLLLFTLWKHGCIFFFQYVNINERVYNMTVQNLVYESRDGYLTITVKPEASYPTYAAILRNDQPASRIIKIPSY